MASRRQWHLSILSAIAGAVLLAACGGSNSPAGPDTPTGSGPAGAPTSVGTFARVVVFGDSLSDLGTYAPATSLAGNGTPPFFGGRFTTNAYNTYASASQQSTATMWPEVVAASLGLVITPAQVGFAGQSVNCPVAAAVPALAGTCTGYGQGGARVTDPNGIGHTTSTGAPAALTVPVVTQVANHLARFGSFNANDLVFVFAGDNDMLFQLGTYSAIAGLTNADLAAGKITAAQASAAIAAAQAGAFSEIENAAKQLAAVVQTIVSKGGKYVVVITPVNIAPSPYGASVGAGGQALLSQMSASFNAWLSASLTGVPVKILDSNAIIGAVLANPASYGFTNTTTPACDVNKISAITGGQVATGSSLFCNASPGVPFNGITVDPATNALASTSTWLFADSVHPTTGGHIALGQAVKAQLHSYGWTP